MPACSWQAVDCCEAKRRVSRACCVLVLVCVVLHGCEGRGCQLKKDSGMLLWMLEDHSVELHQLMKRAPTRIAYCSGVPPAALAKWDNGRACDTVGIYLLSCYVHAYSALLPAQAGSQGTEQRARSLRGLKTHNTSAHPLNAFATFLCIIHQQYHTHPLNNSSPDQKRRIFAALGHSTHSSLSQGRLVLPYSSHNRLLPSQHS